MKTLVATLLLLGLAGAPARAADPAAHLADRIDSFGFDTCMRMGVGGFLSVSACPVVLFKDGHALTDVEALLAPGGPQAHRQAHPKDWTRWRRDGADIQLQKKNGWEKLGFRKTYGSLPKDFRLDGRYRSLTGTGNLAVGGTQTVAAWRDYRFFPDGTVSREGGAGGRAESGNTSVVTGGRAAGRAGRYRIDGLLLTITYDDGSSERRVVITDPSDPKSAIWLDGNGYVRRKD